MDHIEDRNYVVLPSKNVSNYEFLFEKLYQGLEDYALLVICGYESQKYMVEKISTTYKVTY